MPLTKSKPIRVLLLISITSFLLAGCEQDKPDREKYANRAILNAEVGGHELYIPKEYVKFNHTSIGAQSVLLQAWYPGSAIPPGNDSSELLRQGVWWKNIRILLSAKNPDVDFEEFFKRSTSYLDATELVGSEHGLFHFTQPDGAVKDKFDVWVERYDDRPVSYITCSEKLLDTSVPQCTHVTFLEPGFVTKVSYDKRLLPEWKLIMQNVAVMIDRFRLPAEARAHLSEFSTKNLSKRN